MKPIHTTQGFGIIELLVYGSVLIVLTLAIITSVFSLNMVFERNTSERVLADAATAVSERLSRDLRDADMVNLGLSTLNATSSVLVLENGATTTTYSVLDDAVVVTIEGALLGAITPDDVTVTNFNAVQYVGAGSDLVRVTLGLRMTDRYASTTEAFYIAGVLRGSYEE